MDIARQHFLAGPRLAGDQHRRIGRRDLLRKLDHVRHCLVAIDQLARVISDCGKHGRNQLRVRGQRNVLLGAGMNGGDRSPRVVADTAGDDRHRDAFGLEPQHQIANVTGDVHHQQVGATAGAQHVECLLDRVGVGDAGASRHRDLGGGGELSLKAADDQEAHGRVLSIAFQASGINSVPP